ncbi:hypothetical protein [Streptomyces sp. NPDC001165]
MTCFTGSFLLGRSVPASLMRRNNSSASTRSVMWSGYPDHAQ